MDNENESKQKRMSDALSELQQVQVQCEEEFKTSADQWWDNLPYEDKLKAFFSVCKRIHKGDIVDEGSYRYVLYDVFDFSMDSYSIGMMCGYLDIHNSIETKGAKKMNNAASEFIANFPTEEIPASVMELWREWIVCGGVPSGWSTAQADFVAKEIVNENDKERND